MDHPLFISEEDRELLEDEILQRIRTVDFRRLGEESNYNPALVHSLNGLKFSGRNFAVALNGAAMTSDAKGSAEPESGADLSISAEIRSGEESKQKAVLVQAKRRSKLKIKSERDRLVGQIKKMRRITNHPKVMIIEEHTGGIPIIQSASAWLNGKIPRDFELHRWLARRFIRTFDGDQSPELYAAAQSANLDKIWVKAEFESGTKSALK